MSDIVASLANVETIDDTLTVHTLSLDPRGRIEDAVKRLISESFQCLICHEKPMTPPPAAASCCQRLVGCSVCVNEWFRDDERNEVPKRCPSCNGPNGKRHSFIIHGIDAFLREARRLIPQTRNVVREVEDPVDATPEEEAE